MFLEVLDFWDIFFYEDPIFISHKFHCDFRDDHHWLFPNLSPARGFHWTFNQELLLAATAGAGSGHVAGAGATELPLLGQCWGATASLGKLWKGKWFGNFIFSAGFLRCSIIYFFLGKTHTHTHTLEWGGIHYRISELVDWVWIMNNRTQQGAHEYGYRL